MSGEDNPEVSGTLEPSHVSSHVPSNVQNGEASQSSPSRDTTTKRSTDNLLCNQQSDSPQLAAANSRNSSRTNRAPQRFPKRGSRIKRQTSVQIEDCHSGTEIRMNLYNDDVFREEEEKKPLLQRLFCKCCENKKETKQLRRTNSAIEDDPYPLKRQLMRGCFTFLCTMLAMIAVVVSYSMIVNLVESMNNPVRSIHYKQVKEYDAPGIAVYPGGANLLACGHYYKNIVTSKVRLSDLDLVNRNCTVDILNYEDPHYKGLFRDVILFRGPTNIDDREAVFLHFSLNDSTRDFFTVSYFVYPDWDKMNASDFDSKIKQLSDYHSFVPTFALSAGLRMWIKLIMKKTHFFDNSSHTEFKTEYSVVQLVDRRPVEQQTNRLFFIFFEWKNNIVEESRELYTTTPWSMGAGLCGVFLTLHKAYQLAQESYKRVQKDKARRSMRRQTLRRMTTEDHSDSGV